MDKFTSYTDPEFIIAISKELLAVPVLFFVLVVMGVFYMIIRMLIKVIDNKLNKDGKG